MKIVKLETIRIEERPNILWLRVYTDEGLIGLGETFFSAETVETYIHAVSYTHLTLPTTVRV